MRAIHGLTLLALVLGSPLEAQLKLGSPFGDHMVLQRDKPCTVFGTAPASQAIEVRLGKHHVRTKANAKGRWQVSLGKLKSGDGDELVVAGKTTIRCKNVLIGEVWICSGQSNMEWALAAAKTGKAAVAAADLPKIRLFKVPRRAIGEAQTNCEGRWQICSPKTVGGFSAVGYLFGRRLHEDLKGVPIGLVQSAWGGTRAEAWTSEQGMSEKQFAPILERWNQMVRAYEANAKKKPKAWNPTNSPHRPSRLFNGMIAPLTPLTIRGVIWYQGESNLGRAWQYRQLFPAMIKDWRRAFDQGDFPFLFVQLAAFRYGNADKKTCAELWEAQAMTLSLESTAMASAVDVGNPKDIHPRDKLTVADRLALGARALAYGEDIVYSGPIFKQAKVTKNRVVIHFEHVGGGLRVKGKTLTEFQVCGTDKVFHKARAKIVGDTVVVTSRKVKRPIAARYAWHDVPTLSLYNAAGLPASPFRTDDFKGVTYGKVKP